MKKDLHLPFEAEVAERVIAEFGTPLYLYDEAGMRRTAQELKTAFGWAKEYKNYFAVKATPTPAILKVLLEEGMGLDCSSRPELLMAQRLGVPGSDIFYTSNNTPQEDYELAISLDATVNLDDITQLPVFAAALNGGKLTRVAARFNPGELKSGNHIIGVPVDAKYGMTLNQLVQAFAQLKDQNIQEFGLHTMVASNELGAGYFVETAQILLEAVNTIEREAGVHISLINLGGGFGVNYHPGEAPLDILALASGVQEVLRTSGRDLQLVTENGRFVTGPHGYLVSRVRYVMQKYKTYVGLDASMHNLMRPGMYGAYHHITILGKDGHEAGKVYDVVGSLCENNDKFAVDRALPNVEPGDIVVIHDAGAHGHAMGFNYNGMLRSAEVLLRPDGSLECIRRAETADDYFRTVVWP